MRVRSPVHLRGRPCEVAYTLACYIRLIMMGFCSPMTVNKLMVRKFQPLENNCTNNILLDRSYNDFVRKTILTDSIRPKIEDVKF